MGSSDSQLDPVGSKQRYFVLVISNWWQSDDGDKSDEEV